MRLLCFWLPALGLGLAAVAGGSAAANVEVPLDGATVLQRAMDVYATVRTYQDAGEVRTWFIRKERSDRETVRPFTTAFDRAGGRFRFEFRDGLRHKAGQSQADWDRYIVWMDGGEVKTWWTIRPGEETPDSLALALAGATGVSGGSAHLIPVQLLPDIVTGRSLSHRLNGAKLIGVEKIDGVETYKIETVDRRGGVETFWIGCGDYLIRRVYGETHFKTFDARTTTTYQPVANVTVPPGLLDYGAPAAPSP